MARNKVVCFDLDGVLHSYTTPYKKDTIIPDPPVDGMKDAVAEIRKQYRVVVFSTRCRTADGRKAVSEWLSKHGIVVDDVVATKPIAAVYVDDRAITFDGNASTLLEKIQTFSPWYERLNVSRNVDFIRTVNR